MLFEPKIRELKKQADDKWLRAMDLEANDYEGQEIEAYFEAAFDLYQEIALRLQRHRRWGQIEAVFLVLQTDLRPGQRYPQPLQCRSAMRFVPVLRVCRTAPSKDRSACPVRGNYGRPATEPSIYRRS